MKKFRVGVSYSGSVIVEVEVENEDEAYEEARNKVERMGHAEFLDALGLGWDETDIIEEITDE